MNDKPRVVIAGADVTEHVAAMFDAIVGSLDWGSGFLDVDTIESILIVAELAGFDVPQYVPVDPPGFTPLWAPDLASASRLRAEAIAEWRAQVKAKARATATDGDA